ncbi:MAG: SusD/RagB family nutrient-binding outer membrane lipoprotein, partial [Prevotellaceae bacterium]|nr:SusD/RagB family nutrient-binding outer membrane lipoprotein [Prevotellaceae bacterium]
AEATLQGWIPGDDAGAQGFYEEGILTSMEQHSVAAGTYTTGTTSPQRYTDPFPGGNSNTGTSISTVNVSWSNSNASANTKLAKIITQKWIANYPLGFEAWCDFRRTGFPQIYSAQNDLSSESSIGIIENSLFSATTYRSRLVRRLPYPISEYNGNRANVEAAVANMLGGLDKGNVDLWWAKKQ